jgi:hypothetical protein
LGTNIGYKKLIKSKKPENHFNTATTDARTLFYRPKIPHKFDELTFKSTPNKSKTKSSLLIPARIYASTIFTTVSLPISTAPTSGVALEHPCLVIIWPHGRIPSGLNVIVGRSAVPTVLTLDARVAPTTVVFAIAFLESFPFEEITASGRNFRRRRRDVNDGKQQSQDSYKEDFDRSSHDYDLLQLKENV